MLVDVHGNIRKRISELSQNYRAIVENGGPGSSLKASLIDARITELEGASKWILEPEVNAG